MPLLLCSHVVYSWRTNLNLLCIGVDEEGNPLGGASCFTWTRLIYVEPNV